jgi:hypothetical protein
LDYCREEKEKSGQGKRESRNMNDIGLYKIEVEKTGGEVKIGREHVSGIKNGTKLGY